MQLLAIGVSQDMKIDNARNAARGCKRVAVDS